MVTNINFLPMISIDYQEISLWELIKWSSKRNYVLIFYQILNTYFFKEIYRDQFGEFVWGYWGLKS